MNERDLELNDGRTLHVYDTRPDAASARLAIFWHHGTPNLGEPPEPMLPAAAQRGIRWLSYDRPGYGGSTVHPGRDVASAAADVCAIADALGIGRFAVMGHSGGGVHALASGALLSERCPSPDWRHTVRRDWIGSRAWGPPVPRSCARPQADAPRSWTT